MRIPTGRTRRGEWSIGLAAIVILGAVVASCSDTATRAPEKTTTSIVEIGTAEPTSSTTESTNVVDSAEQRCMQFAPSDHGLFANAEAVSIGDIRSIVVATPPPTPTSLLLPGHDSSEQALMCWSTSTDRTSLAQFWITTTGDARVFCTEKFLEQASADQVANLRCP
ncbi:MAG: hypothetical protein ABIZ69_06020 [Ilumatobacteraceae bacterium]